MTPLEFAEHRRCCRKTVYHWVDKGLPSVRQGHLRLIPVKDADAWLDAGGANVITH
jgi:excisionase family DNA binding protein